ncbi:MAG: hypothetical protein RL660_1531 [Bacteroidota bacterium]|jgi:hypothetical protein
MEQQSFHDKAIALYHKQLKTNELYSQFVGAIKPSTTEVNSLTGLPFLPIEFFKTHKVLANKENIEAIFESSGTSQMQRAKHYISNLDFYKQHSMRLFQEAYGDPKDLCILALLPHYQQQGNSSLVCMVDHLIANTQHKSSGFFLDNNAGLYKTLLENISTNTTTILFGVTYALLDFAEAFTIPQNTCLSIIETGGMKGRGTELTREALHDILCPAFGVNSIHSEYGMTELLSQAYSKGKGIYKMNDSLRVLVRDVNDPFDIKTQGRGALNIIDLANIDSCAFIATQDQGEVFEDGTFTVSGRLDNSDMRGCSLLTA